jgi:N-acetylmuramoyl-L-alanine amidase
VVEGWGSAVARLATASVIAALPAVVRAAPPVLEGLHVQDVRGGRALIVRFSDGFEPRVVAVRGADGTLQRLQLDLPPGTRLARSVPRLLEGAPPIVRTRVGLVEPGRLRIVLDVRDGHRFVVRTADEGKRLSVAVASPISGANVPAARSRPVRVVLDAGHGGDDPGAIGYVVEKHVTLDVVRRLARRLREEIGVEVVLTRSSDATVALAERTAVANQAGADLFLSIHANANPHGKSKGVETYVLDNTNDRATLRLAAMENGSGSAVHRTAATNLDYILSSLVQSGKMPDSRRLARAIQGELVQHVRARYPGVDDLGVKRGPFYVLVGSHMPGVLVEMSFVTHPVEGRRLRDEAYRVALADGLARGIRRFLVERQRAPTL